MDRAVLGVDRHELGARASRAAAARPARRRSATPCWPAPGACRPASVASVTGSPAKPTTPLTTTSASSASDASASGPATTSATSGSASASSARARRRRPRRPCGRNSARLCDQRVDRRRRAERDHLEAVGLGAHDVERLGPDRARRADDGDDRVVTDPGYCRLDSLGESALRDDGASTEQASRVRRCRRRGRGSRRPGGRRAGRRSGRGCRRGRAGSCPCP